MSGYLQDELERDLVALGGQPLYPDTHDEAGAYVDEQYPRAGRGDEPRARVCLPRGAVAAGRAGRRRPHRLTARTGTGPVPVLHPGRR